MFTAKQVPSKIQCFHHSKKRALERYGLDLSEETFEILNRAIQRGGKKFPATFIADQDRYRALFLIEYEAKDLYVIYIRSVKAIVTFLTEDMIRETIPGFSDRSFSIREILMRLRQFLGGADYQHRLARRFEPFDVPAEWLQEDGQA